MDEQRIGYFGCSLLLIDGIINLGLGALLIIFPETLVAALGVPDAAPTFYPNILGGVLFGIGIALLIERKNQHGGGIGLGLWVAVWCWCHGCCSEICRFRFKVLFFFGRWLFFWWESVLQS